MKSVFGRYLHGDSFLHRVDPRLKIIMTITYIVFVFLSYYFIDMIIILIPILIAYIITTKRVFPLFSLIKFPLIISIVIFFINVYAIRYADGNLYDPSLPLGYPPESITSRFPEFRLLILPKSGIAITYESINKTIALFIRIYIMILVTTLLSNTTKPILLTKALEDLMLPLKLLFVPVHIVAMIISIALRFIPTLLDEAFRIMKAQSSRGVDFRNGKLKEKIIAFTTLIIPLFVSSFAKAEDLSYAMETRGYDPYAKRVRYRKLQPTWKDAIILFGMFLVMTFLIINIFNVNNYLPFWYAATEIV